MHASSFDPIVGECPRVLILGSMPGVRSLQAGEYYAHPRNAFWRILGDLGCCDPSDGYGDRITALRRSGIALWDVLATCDRQGSLDGNIVRKTEQPNDIRKFLETHPTLRAIFFNGSKAEQAFRSHILADLQAKIRERCLLRRLPSTSPAHAIPYGRKLDAWRTLLPHLRERDDHHHTRT